MTTPPMSTTGSFQGTLHPHQVAQVLNMLVSGSPFSGTALTPYPTNRSAVAFPTARPDRPAWLGEGEDIPVIGLGDDADIVAVCKLASIVLLSNEGFSDASVNMTAQFGDLLRDSASIELDRGVLYGTDCAGTARGGGRRACCRGRGHGRRADHRDRLDRRRGRDRVSPVRPAVRARRAAQRPRRQRAAALPRGARRRVRPGRGRLPELAPADVLVVARDRAWLITRNDFLVDTSRDWAFQKDALAVRLRGRFAVAAPVLAKALRKLTITPRARAAKS